MPTRRSGYRVTIHAFLPADVNNPASISFAQSSLINADEHLETEGFICIERKQRYYQSTEVNDGGGQVSMPSVGVEDDPKTAEKGQQTVVEKGDTPTSHLEAPGASDPRARGAQDADAAAPAEVGRQVRDGLDTPAGRRKGAAA